MNTPGLDENGTAFFDESGSSTEDDHGRGTLDSEDLSHRRHINAGICPGFYSWDSIWSVLFENTFGTEEMRDVVNEERYIQKFMTVEAALARAEARAGVIPSHAADEISEKASLEHVEMEAIRRNVAEMGIVSMSIIEAWKEKLGDAGEYVHWGATSQEISDMAVVLQLQEAYALLGKDMDESERHLRRLADEYADTPMIGRTHYVHAQPITFGLKAGSWLDEFERHIDRFEELEDRLFVAELFGATGTLASLGERGPEVQRYLADELDLPMPDVTWFAARDRFAELLNLLSMIATTASRIANQILLLNRPEVGEIRERIPEGEVGSSTMPHKRNPKRSETIVALSKLVRANAHAMTEIMETVGERSASTWYAEFALVPETLLYTSRCLANLCSVLGTLEIDAERMKANLELQGELVTSEPIMMSLSGHVGRQSAHRIVYEVAMEAIARDRSFTECLLDDERVTAVLSEEEIRRISDPSEALGLAPELVRRMLNDGEE